MSTAPAAPKAVPHAAPAATAGRLAWLHWLAPALAFLAPLAVYVRSLAPAEVGGDAGEFQVVPTVLGIPHYTGYPLYTLLGHLWLLLDPAGTPAYRLNLLSAVFGALACLAVYAGVRAAGGGIVPGLIGASTLAICPLEWEWSAMAGVRAAAAAFTALILALAFRWGRVARGDGAEGQQAQPWPGAAAGRRWLLLCLGLGFALAHHRSSAFFLPALALYVPLTAPRFLLRWRLLLAGAALFALPLLLYLYLPIRSTMGTPYDQFHPTTWPTFAELVFAPQLSRALLSVPPAEMPARIKGLGGALRDQLGVLTWLCALGLAAAIRFRPRELLLAGVFGLLVCAQIVDWNIAGGLNVVYLIPVLVVSAFLAAAGAELLLRLAKRAPKGSALAITAACLLLIGAGLVSRGWNAAQARRAATHLALDSYHQDLTAGWRGHRLAAASIPYLAPNALIAGDWEQATIFWYQKLVAKTLPNIAIDFGNGTLADMSFADLATRYPGRPIYLGRNVPWAAGHHPSAAGPLISLSDTPRLVPPPAMTPVGVNLEGGMELIAYQLFDEQGERVTTLPSRSDVVGVMLAWRAAQVQQHNLSVSLRLLDAAGHVVRGADSANPVYGLAPTNTWAAGEVVCDYYELPLAGLAPGQYHLLVLLYYQPTPGKFQNLQALDAAGKPAGEGVTFATLER